MNTPKKKQRVAYLAMLVGVSMMVVCFSGCDRTPPGPVTALVAAAGNAQIALNWTNPADTDLNGVKILRKTGTAPSSNIDGEVIFNAKGTSYTDLNLLNGIQYFYAAYAYDKAGNIAIGAQASATPIVPDTTPPAAVSGFTAMAGNAQIVLAWTNPGDVDLAGVKVLRKTGSAPSSSSDGDVIFNGLGATYTDTGLTNGTKYFYAAFAYDNVGNHATGTQANATPMAPDTTPPGMVTNFSADAGDAQVILTWTNPGDVDLAGVKVLRKTGSTPTSATDGSVIYDELGTTHTDATAVNGTEYFYAAFTYDNADNYADGAQTSATPTSASALEEILSELVELQEEIIQDPDNVLTEEQEEGLSKPLVEAEALYRGGDPCGAADVLDMDFLPLAQEVRQGDAIGTAEELYNMGRMLRYDMLGAVLVKSACPGAERLGLEVAAKVEEQNTENVAGLGLFGEPLVQTIALEDSTKAGGREVFTEVTIPGANAVLGDPGKPGIPVYRELIAAPMGAKVSVVLTKAEPVVAEEIYLNLYPCQEQPVDAPPDPSIFENKPFIRNAEVYAENAAYPPEPVTLLPLGNARDMQYYLVEIAAGQYFPLGNKLVLFDNVKFEVEFKGGDGAFLSEAMLNPFESNADIFTEAVLNKNIIKNYVIGKPNLTLSGEEFLILTHPDFNDAAIALRDWKREKGIWTNVIQCGTGSGITGRTTKEEIDAWIHEHYDSVFIRPSYILLLGDAEFIAPFYQNGIGTDWTYAILGTPGVDTVPDFAVGRIPVDTLEQANTVVNKIIAYEKNPPMNADFYGTAALAAQFQCCRAGAAYGTAERTFTEVSEFARNVMVSAGKTVDRLYVRTGSQTPTRYYDGTLLPAAIGAASGFPWDADEADITNAWNDGRFLIMHRDHGWQEGWSHPEYELPAIDDLTNGVLQPVVFSVNCASGFWDNETAGGAYGTTVGGVYFCEKLLRKANGGAVGILGDTRNSPSWANSVLTQGFYDAIWPSAIGSFGGTASQRRLGDILNHGKLYLMSKVGFSVMGETIYNSDAVSELYLWHCIGDPTMEIWTRNPYLLVLPELLKYRFIEIYYPFPPEGPLYAGGINLEYAVEGAEITIYRAPGAVMAKKDEDGDKAVLAKRVDPLGRGVVKNGVAFIEFLEDLDTRQSLQFIATAENAQAKLLNAKKLD